MGVRSALAMTGSAINLNDTKRQIDASLAIGDLGAWETNFLRDIRQKIEKYGERIRLTEKQINKLSEIFLRAQSRPGPWRPVASNRQGKASRFPSKRKTRAGSSVPYWIKREARWLSRRFVRDFAIVAAFFVGLAVYWALTERGMPFAGRNTQFFGASTELISGTFFSMCGRPPHYNCVIDGDTFYLANRSIRIADIDAPEVSPPRCQYEAERGARATRRLHELLNAGSFELNSEGRDEDQYGRKLRIVTRDGTSVGSILVAEELAREWTGRRLPWCD